MNDDDRMALLAARKDLALDAIDNARRCIRDFRGDLALKALDVAEHQISHLEPRHDP